MAGGAPPGAINPTANQGASWGGFNQGPANTVMKMAGEVAGWDFLDGTNFGDVGAGEVLVGPMAGDPSGPATFRTLQGGDLPAGQYPGTPTNDNAQEGNVGEYVFSEIASGAAIVLGTTVISNITSIPLTAGDWDVWGSIAYTAAITSANGWISTIGQTDPGPPNFGAYAAGGTQFFPVGRMRVEVAEGQTATLFLSQQATFAGTPKGYGFLGARRAR